MAIRELELRKFTPEEFLAIERRAEERSQYVCGHIYNMAGASPRHELLCANVVAALHRSLKPMCHVYGSNLRIRTTADGLFTYPDASVVCGALQFHDEREDTVTNPMVILDVLSKSTERFDRGGKFDLCKSIASLRSYILIAQHRPRVELFVRQPDGEWTLTVTEGLSARLEVESVGSWLDMSDIYRGVTFDASENQHH
jgi:Uma2 family endonuclease